MPVALLSFALATSAVLQVDPVHRLGSWVARARIAPRSVDEERVAELRAILGELRVAREHEREGSALDLALVELASLEWREDDPPPATFAECARFGRLELATELARPNPALAARLAFEVLAPAARRPRAERLLAAQLLERQHIPPLFDSLRDAALEPDRELAEAATAALLGWDLGRVHVFFLDGLRHGRVTASVAGEHFERTRSSLEAPVLESLEHEVARRYLADDWRAAARARRLGRGLDVPRKVPIWIEALATWTRRTREGKGSKRVVSEILEDLQRLSGKAIGADAARWSEWWDGVRNGRIALPTDIAAAGGQLSSATFFGLHAATDRVVFVVDRSTSMETTLGTGRRTRYEEAIEQLVHFLTSAGPETRFSLALFSQEGRTWRERLAPATALNVEQAKSWMAARGPAGGTRLFEGLRAGLELDRDGHLELERCEADTVIVLCDGATNEGPKWVARWLAAENEAAQLVFHCIQIGSGGDGTLEALAQGSGGQFLRVQE